MRPSGPVSRIRAPVQRGRHLDDARQRGRVRRRRIRFHRAILALTRNIYWLGLLGLLSYAGYQSYYIFFETSYFRIQDVQVRGMEDLPRREVLQIAQIELGSHFFRYSLDEVEKRLARSPAIARAKVVQVTPNRISIDVEENRPVARMLWRGEEYLVGRDGRMRLRLEGQHGDLPRLEGLRAEVSSPGVPRLPPGKMSRIEEWTSSIRRSLFKDATVLDLGQETWVELAWRGMVILADDPETLTSQDEAIRMVLRDSRARRHPLRSLDLRFGMLVVTYRE